MGHSRAGLGTGGEAGAEENRHMSNDDPSSPPGGVDWVELKVSLDAAHVDDGLGKLGLDPTAPPPNLVRSSSASG